MYQLICPVSDDKVKYSSIAIDNLTDLFPEDIFDSSNLSDHIAWRVVKFPNGVEDFADWMCRASEVTAKIDTYYFPPDGEFGIPVFFDTRTEVSSVDPVTPKSPLPVLRSNIDYAGGYSSEIPLGDPRIKHNGSRDFSMGGSIDLYDPSQPYLSSLEATKSSPDYFGYLKSGPTGDVFIVWPDSKLRMFLFKGDFYVAVPFLYNSGTTEIIEFNVEVSSKKIKVTLLTRTFAFDGAGGISEYTITDTFA